MTGNQGTSFRGAPDAGPTITQDSDHIIKPSDLKPGDVLLYRSNSAKKHQQKISEATGSPYTHASIYLGDGLVAESNFPDGVSKRKLEDSIKGSRCVAVLRSQNGFGSDRHLKLIAFVEDVLGKERFYNLIAVVGFKKASQTYFDNQLEIVRESYGKVTSPEDFAKQSFFCSAFVVACLTVVGIIGPTAQSGYLPEAFSPASLYKDPTFGWLVGFLVPDGGSVPKDDPVLINATPWQSPE